MEEMIKAALLKGERVTLECKRARSEVPKELWKTYSAFANTIGGLILLGVDGFPKIIAAWKETSWGETELKNKIEVDEVELILPVPATSSNVVKDVAKELTDRQHVILKLIKENPSLSASDMSQKTGMVLRTIQRDLATLHEKGYLTREGGRKDGRWVILKDK